MTAPINQTFVSGTTISSEWLNGVNDHVNDQETSAHTASNIEYTPAGTSAVATTVQAKLRESVSVKDFGAVGDGITDDTTSIQAALDLGVPVFVPKGRYLVSATLVWTDGTVLFSDNAPLFNQFSTNAPTLGDVAEIFYTGVGGANSCVCRMSKVAVGTLPTYQSDESQTLRGAGIHNIYVNGNALAEFGVYSARAGMGNLYNNVVVTNTKKHGFWFGQLWNAQLFNLVAAHNYGCGITIGADTFSWSGGNTVNAVEISSIYAQRNGRDLASWTTSDYKSGVGIGLYLGRACNVTMLDAEWNEGVGIVIEPSSGPSSYSEIYAENNCATYPTSLQRYQIWYQSGESAYYQKIDGVYCLFNSVTPSGNTNAPRLKIAGTAPASSAATYGQDHPVFARIAFLIVIEADFGYYKVTDTPTMTSGTIRFTSHFPQYNDPETIDSTQTTLYVASAATGTGSGIDTSNYMLIDAAMRVAKCVSSITSIDVSAKTSTTNPATAVVLDGTGFTRRLTISGGTTGRFFYSTGDGVAVVVSNWDAQLSLSGLLSLDRVMVRDSQLEIDDCPTTRTGANNSALAAIVIDRSSVEINGTTVINVSGSTAATKIGVSLQGLSNIVFSNAAAGTIAGYTAGNAIHFGEGSGTVYSSITTATATWASAANVTRNAGGGAGMVLAPNGLNP